MKAFIVFGLLMLSFTLSEAQNVHVTLFGGVSNYQGDLQAKRFTFQQAKAAFGAGVLYEFSPKLYGRANVTFGKVEGNDKLSNTYAIRNLSFSSSITDVHLGLEYDLLNSYNHSIVPFVFGGISVFRFNPSALDTAGQRVYLQPLGTEGQGFFQGREKYDLTALALPFGGGLKFSLNENVKVRFEVGLRKTMTDYLDDVSTTYADQNELLANNGQQAVDLAFRGDEDKNGQVYPPANTVRGNSGSKDWYYFTGLGVSFRLKPKFDGAPGGKQKTGCPTNVY